MVQVPPSPSQEDRHSSVCLLLCCHVVGSAHLFALHWQKLSEMIPKSAVGELNEDSSNIIELIQVAYNVSAGVPTSPVTSSAFPEPPQAADILTCGALWLFFLTSYPLALVYSWIDGTFSTIFPKNLSSRIILDHSTLPHTLEVKYDSKCKNDKDSTDEARGQCDNVKINDEVCSPVPGTPHKLAQFLLHILFNDRNPGCSSRLSVYINSMPRVPKMLWGCGKSSIVVDVLSLGPVTHTDSRTSGPSLSYSALSRSPSK